MRARLRVIQRLYKPAGVRQFMPRPTACFPKGWPQLFSQASASAARYQEFPAGGCRIARFTYRASRQRTGGVTSQSRFFNTIFTGGRDCAGAI
jgi:hypothetical protein